MSNDERQAGRRWPADQSSLAIALAALAMATLLAGASSPDAAASGEGSAGTDWRSHGGGTDESGYSALDQINVGNASKLGLAWSLDLPGEASLEATPLEVGGTLYFTGSYSAVYAVDAASGRLLWRYDPEIWRYPAKTHIVFPVNRGCAYADGRVFVGTLDGRLLALDAKTGKLVWSVDTLPAGSMNSSTGAPLAFKDKVLIGNGGADYGARGFVTAYDQKTGKQAWRFYTVPGSPEQNAGDPAMEAAARTWSGDYWKTGTGGTVWNGLTFDPALNRVYIGTGNSGPYDPAVRSPEVKGANGDNLYLASIVALDADTGKYIWHYQVNPREAWDYKATADMILATIPVHGRRRRVLMQAPTNGFFYVLDRENGKLISAEKIGKVTWAQRIDLTTGRPVENPNIRYETGVTEMWPSQLGTHNWQPMSFSPRTGLVYIPAMQLGTRWSREAQPGDVKYKGVVANPIIADAADAKGTLLAWDPVAKKQAWQVPRGMMWNGGTLATGGNLVFQGTADGLLSAYDAHSGKQLWHFDAGLGIVSAPISFAVGGRQYVSVLVGYGGNTFGAGLLYAGWKFGAQPRRLLTFALNAHTRLAPAAPRDMELRPVDDPAFKIDEASLDQGHRLFVMHCAVCHGPNVASSATAAPDLRESVLPMDPQAFSAVLHDGALERQGMPCFGSLSPAEIGTIAAYIRAKAREALGTRKPSAEEDLPITF
jgi:quinohemoprotein ethanol dehydrogenase